MKLIIEIALVIMLIVGIIWFSAVMVGIGVKLYELWRDRRK